MKLVTNKGKIIPVNIKSLKNFYAEEEELWKNAENEDDFCKKMEDLDSRHLVIELERRRDNGI